MDASIAASSDRSPRCGERINGGGRRPVPRRLRDSASEGVSHRHPTASARRVPGPATTVCETRHPCVPRLDRRCRRRRGASPLVRRATTTAATPSSSAPTSPPTSRRCDAGPTTDDDVDDLIDLWRDIGDDAPLAIEEEWDAHADNLETGAGRATISRRSSPAPSPPSSRPSPSPTGWPPTAASTRPGDDDRARHDPRRRLPGASTTPTVDDVDLGLIGASRAGSAAALRQQRTSDRRGQRISPRRTITLSQRP